MLHRDAFEYKRDAVRVTIGVLVGSLLYKASEPLFYAVTNADQIAHACTFAEQAQQWLNTSLQDKNVQTKLQHVYLAAAYLQAARHLVNDATLERSTGLDVHNMQVTIENTQVLVNRDFSRQCHKAVASTTAKPKHKPTWM